MASRLRKLPFQGFSEVQFVYTHSGAKNLQLRSCRNLGERGNDVRVTSKLSTP